MNNQLSEGILKRPIVVILGFVALMLVLAYGMSFLTFKSDYRVFFGKDNPQLIAFENMQSVFTKNDSVAFIVAPKNGAVFTPQNLAAIYELTQQAWQVPYTSRVDSITNYQHTTANDDDLVVEDLVLDPQLLPQLDLEKMQRIVLLEPTLKNKLISEDAAVTIVNATIQLPGIDPVTELPEVASKAREIRATVLEQYPDMDIYLSGLVMMNNTFSEASIKDSSTLIPLMFLVVALTMMVLLRSITGSIATLVIVIFAIVGTLGIGGWLGFFLTGPSASAPTVIMTLAVADCIHVLSTMLYEMRHGMTKHKAILESLRVNLQPIFLTSVTTAIGFLTMNFSDSPPFGDLGNLVAIGVILAFIFSVTLFPALLSVLPIKVSVESASGNNIMDKLSDFVIGKRRVLLPVFALVIVFFATFVPKNTLNDDFVKYFDTSLDFRQATDFMQENMGGLMTQEISVDSKQSGGINTLEYLNMLDKFSRWVNAQPETDHVSILSTVLKRLNKNMHGDDQQYYRLPDNRELAAQYLLLYELSLPYGLDLNNQIDVDKAATRIVVTTKNTTSAHNIAMEERIGQWFAENAPNYAIVISSPNTMFAHIGQRNIYSMLLGTSVALILISLLIGFALRSVKFGVISLIPNIVPAAMGFGLWYFLDGQIGLALSVVAGMTLGIVVDDTVHFLSKYLRARREKNQSSEQAVRYAFNSVGRALWITTLVLFCGFMVLAQSSFKMNSDMGLLTAITIVIALVIDFLFLPPLLMKLDNDKRTSTKGDNHVSTTV